jgi:hypothetical protein
MDQYLHDFWAFLSPWIDAGSGRLQVYGGVVADFLSSPSNRETVVRGVAIAVLAGGLIFLLLKLRGARLAVRRLSAELEEIRSKYDAEVRWRLARERHENKSQSQPSKQTQLAS